MIISSIAGMRMWYTLLPLVGRYALGQLGTPRCQFAIGLEKKVTPAA